MVSGASNYSAILKVLLDMSGVQAQINSATKGKTINIKANIDTTSLNTVTNQMQKWNDKLAVFSSKNPTLFNTGAIQTQVTSIKSLMTSYDGTKNSAKAVNDAFSHLNSTLRVASNNTQNLVHDGDNLATTLQKDIAKVAEWMVATTLIIGTLQQIREGIQYIEDLNKAMTNIGMVTGQTADQLGGMVQQFNTMARELGVDTLAVAEGATEWIRQGKTAAETTDLLRSSTMMSKLGNLEAADATDKLIAVTNAYNISAKDSIQVVDVLINLDNKFATSTGEIASAMQKSASMAKLAGVSYQDLASYITVISATTRQSGETIGQALKTVFARMEQVRAGASIDEEGESINNVEKVLLKNGIALRDNANSFRDMSDVLQDVAVKYQELAKSGDTVSQQQIIGAIAGKLRMPEHMKTYGQYYVLPLTKQIICGKIIYC